MDRVYPWHQMAKDVAIANALTEDSELQIATELSRAIQMGTVQCWKENGDPIRGSVPVEMLRRLAPHLTVDEGNAWLKRNGYLHEWEPVKPSALPVLVSSPLGTVNRIQAKRQSWRDVAWPYVVQVFSEGQYTTAKDLYGALEKKTDTENSPFERGVGPNRGKLIVSAINESVSLKTIQNYWPAIQSEGK